MKKLFALFLVALLLCGCAAKPGEKPPVDDTTLPPNTTAQPGTTSPHDTTMPSDTTVSPETTEHTETTKDNNSDVASPSVGGSIPCIHTSFGNNFDYDRSYHSIDGRLMQYVGDERVYAWAEEKWAEQGVEISTEQCNTHFTIYDFVHDFNIPREVFEALNDNYLRNGYDYNLDVIYASREEAEAYYTSDRSDKIFERERFRFFKGQLSLYVESLDESAEKKWIERKNATEWGFSEATTMHMEIPNLGIFSDDFVGFPSQYSCAEYIKEFNIPRTVVEDIVKNVFGAFTIDLDRLYSELDSDTLLRTTDGKNIDPFVIDQRYIVMKYDDVLTVYNSEVNGEEKTFFETENKNISGETIDDLCENIPINDQKEPEVNEDEATGASGGINLCKLHAIDFHTFTGEMIEYVGEQQFQEWYDSCATKKSGIDGCLYNANIYRFIEHFDIPREAFEKIYYESVAFYFSDYDINILYSTDETTVSQYYISNNRSEEREKFSSLGEIKLCIAEYAMLSNDEKMKTFFEMYCRDKSIIEWSIADFVRTTGIKKSEFQTVINDMTVRKYPDGTTIVLDCFDFDYDAIYSNTGLITVRTTGEESVVDKHNEDLIFCRRPQLSVELAFENVSVD